MRVEPRVSMPSQDDIVAVPSPLSGTARDDGPFRPALLLLEA